MSSTVSFETIEAVYPLSPAQQGILFHTLYAQQSQVYFLQVSCSLAEDLDVAAFERAWQQLVARHLIFRTAFVWDDVSEPLQVVGRNVKLPLQRHDWRGMAGEEQQKKLREFLDSDRERGFDLSEAPLMRLSLIRLGDQLFQFTWSLHHILLDGWSQSIILKEIFTLYEANRRGQKLDLPVPRPYREYIAWLRRQDLAPAASFWRRTLAGFRAPTRLPLGRAAGESRPTTAAYHQQLLRLSPGVTAELNRFARRQRVTLNTVVQGAWALLLSRLSGERDVVFGAVVSGRSGDLAGVGEMVGVFINTLPVRVRVGAEQTVGEWLRGLQGQQAEMRQYEHSPLVEVQGWSDVPRSQPLFESIFDFQNYSLSRSVPQRGRELKIDDFGFIARTNYPLEMVVQSGPELTLLVTHDYQRSDDEAATHLLRYMRTLLERIAREPEQKLSELSLLTDAERDQLIVIWNDTDAYYPAGKLTHQLFEEQAARTPEAVALVCRGRELTYEELNCKANRLARSLADHGVGADVLVPLLAERGADLLTAILAVFKAGGAYIPLDPDHPASRLRQVLAQSKAPLVITERPFVPVLTQALAEWPGKKAPRVLLIDELLRPDYEDTNLLACCTPRNLAYVIYTSGSTGTPKGAMVEHRGMLNHLYAKILELDLTRRDVVAQTASQCFDISVWQFLATLLVGGRVHVLGDEIIHDSTRLLDEVEGHAISIFETVPTLLRATLEDAAILGAARRDFSRLRWLIMTGEALPPDLCREWLQLFPRTPLLNAYGPTECSDDVTHQRIHQPPPEEVAHVPIGRPIINTQLYVLDSELRPAPSGASGELYVGGEGVGRGYLNEPHRTAEVFLPDPFAKEQGRRLYRTGDVARHLPDGEVVYLGRIDHQVKIRGFRIELGEIEVVLGEHEAVRQCVVVVREDAPGTKRIIAYVVADENPPQLVNQLRAYLKERLPEYMLPTAFMMLAALPLTANGKVDRRALPAPDTWQVETPVAFVAPQTPTEQTLAEIWVETLRVERIGIDDNFFDLGGHSLSATQLVSRVRARLGVDLSLADFFAAATIRSTAEKIEGLLVEKASAAKIDELLDLLEGLNEYESENMLGITDAPDRI